MPLASAYLLCASLKDAPGCVGMLRAIITGCWGLFFSVEVGGGKMKCEGTFLNICYWPLGCTVLSSLGEGCSV